MQNNLKTLFLTMLALMLFGCATPQKSYDYAAFKRSNPKSILVLPPLNNSPDVKASYTFLSVATYPLAEAGYYVFPVALVEQSFRENGLMNPGDIHQVSLKKLDEIFGADAVLYITVEKFGSSYYVINSEARVTASAKLLDVKTGAVLWEGRATAADTENDGNSQGGLVGLLVIAVVKQIASNVGTDPSLRVSTVTSARLLSAHKNGMLFGPRSPNYGKD
jgi:hypothetical protein